MIYKVMQSPLDLNTHTNTQRAAFVAGLIQFIKVRSFQRRGGKIPSKKKNEDIDSDCLAFPKVNPIRQASELQEN